MPSLEQLEKLLAADPGDAFVLYGLAQEHAKRRDWVQAIEFYDRCLGADPKYCYAHYHKARALEGKGDRAGAVEVLKAGMVAARHVDAHAAAEMEALLDELT